MSEAQAVQRPRLEVAIFCHTEAVTIPVPPAIINREQFPAAKEGFEEFVAAKHVTCWGGHLSAVDISGLSDQEVSERLRSDLLAFRTEVSALDFLQALEFLNGRYGLTAYPAVQPRYIAAYHGGGWLSMAERLPDGGFRRVFPDALRKSWPAVWPAGTLGIFSLPSL